MSDYNILGTVWFGPSDGTIGMVAIATGMGGWKAYVGVGKGYDAAVDAQHIASWGARLPQHIAVAVFPHLDARTYGDMHLNTSKVI